MKCRCCNNDIKTQKCDYCGFFNYEVLEVAVEEEQKKKGQEYKDKLVAGLGDFSVVVYQYEFNSAKSQLKSQSVTEILASSLKCGGGFVWSKNPICRTPAENGSIKINITYTLHGKKKQTIAEIPFLDFVGELKIGVALTDDLHLIVSLGDANKNSSSLPCALDLR